MRQFLVRTIRWVRNVFRSTFRSANPELPYVITLLVAFVIFVAALKGFIEITDELAENELESFDQSVSDFVISFRNDSLTPFFKFMTEMGDRIAYSVITLALGIYLWVKHRNWKYIVQTVLTLLLATASNVFLKHIIHRARPGHEHLVTVNTLSFPSGHSMSAMAFYGFLFYLTFNSKMPRTLKYILCPLLILIIFSIGISRIYLGVHFPSDVAAGFTGGLIWVTLCAMIFNILSLWRKRRISAPAQN